MKKINKKTRSFTLGTTLVHGVCPCCKQFAPLLFIIQDFYRCTFCGEDTEQKVNGVIKYIPLNMEQKEMLDHYYGEKK